MSKFELKKLLLSKTPEEAEVAVGYECGEWLAMFNAPATLRDISIQLNQVLLNELSEDKQLELSQQLGIDLQIGFRYFNPISH